MGLVLLGFYIVLGILLGLYLFENESYLKRMWLGATIGMMLMMWSHVPFSFLLGFSIPSHLLGALLSVAISTLCILYKVKKFAENPLNTQAVKRNKYLAPISQIFKKPTKSEIVMMICVVPFLILSILLVENHTLVLIDGAYYCGQCTYGDMNMHLGFISSIAEQQMFPPTYSILAGEPLNYPFLCDSISSSVMLFGNSLRTSYIAPMVLAFALVYEGIWFLAEAIIKKPGRTVLAYILFVLDGGLGIMYFLDGTKTNKANFTRIFTAFYETPTNYVAENVRWTNIIADMLLPQRATLFGWACLFAVLYILYKAVFEEEDKYFLIAGIMAGLLPMIHTHSYFSVGLIAMAWIVVTLIRDKFAWKSFKKWLFFGIPALALSIPQLLMWTLNAVGGESFLRFTFNWINSTADDTWLWFWVKNLGILFLLIPSAFLHSDRKKKCIYSGALFIFVIAELIIFQPNLYDNIKLFFIWYFFMGVMVADFLADIYEKIKCIKGTRIIAGLVILIMTVSGALTIAREYNSGLGDNAYQLYNRQNTKAAEWISENTEPTSVFLCWNQHNNSIASLTGRNIYVGAGTFLYFHGVDYQSKEALMKRMFQDAEIFEANKEEAGIDYVYIGDYERGNISGIIEDYFEENYELVYSELGINIYKIK